MPCGFVPDYLIERLAAADDPELADCGRRAAAIDSVLRSRPAATVPPTAPDTAWQVFDAGNGSVLPGRLVRWTGQPETADPAVDEVAAGVTEALALFADLGRSSYDGRGATVVASVHYQRDYDNAFWDGRQLVFGDGDGRVFERFTRPIDVLGHELSHAVVEHTAAFRYGQQPGALNESVSDVFAACLKQRHLGQQALEADWLVGEGIFRPGVNGRALRSMETPGTAYDGPLVGRDPQVGSMADYVVTASDHGGVHLNSGIPNRAFVLAATGIGGESWSGAGRIWYDALVSGLGPETDFAAFAAATVTAAGNHASLVEGAWTTVGVLGRESSPARAPEQAQDLVEVTRTGGFGGLVRDGSVDLASGDPRAAEVRDLVRRIDFAAVEAGEPQPDRFVYRFRHAADQCRVQEQALSTELRRLAQLVLEE